MTPLLPVFHDWTSHLRNTICLFTGGKASCHAYHIVCLKDTAVNPRMTITMNQASMWWDKLQQLLWQSSFCKADVIYGEHFERLITPAYLKFKFKCVWYCCKCSWMKQITGWFLHVERAMLLGKSGKHKKGPAGFGPWRKRSSGCRKLLLEDLCWTRQEVHTGNASLPASNLSSQLHKSILHHNTAGMILDRLPHIII